MNISDLIDENRIGGFQIGIYALCGASLVMAGFNAQAMGYVAPAIIADWNIAASELGPVFGAGNLGFLIGCLLFGILADKIGRRPVLVFSTVFFSVMTLLTVRSASVQELLALRFITGIGLGCILPNTTALIGEYSPRRKRIPLIMITVGVGFTGGAALVGFIAAWLIPAFGWNSIFYTGGAVSLVIALLMYFGLPESLKFLVLRKRNPENVEKWLRRIDATAPSGSDVEYVIQEEDRKGVPVLHLLRDGRALVTLLLWTVNFMNLLILWSLSSWLPTIIREAGYSTSNAVLVGASLQMGGVGGVFGLAWVISRSGFFPTLPISFGLACISIALIGQPGISLVLLTAMVFIAGWCVIGSQGGINAVAATYYPTYLRSTGVGWALGVGRFGAIVGPVLGGEALRLQWSAQQLFLAAAVPALISALVMVSLRWMVKGQDTADTKTEVMAH